MRKSGILLPISSIPNNYFIGDFGPTTYRFVDFLVESGFSIWEVLPLSPTSEDAHYCPYSSCSSFACATCYVSPELLVSDGLLQQTDIPSLISSNDDMIEHKKGYELRSILLEKAYNNFLVSDYKDEYFLALHNAYIEFCNKESYWLDDYALYLLLKEKFSGKSWNKWPNIYKWRDNYSLSNLSNEPNNAHKIGLIKFSQFIAYKQWSKLRKYCNDKGITIIGDLPIYCNPDSVDIWNNPKQFNIDKEGNALFVGGVPPAGDKGQRWRTPTYKWDVIAQNNFTWWIQRITRNIELYDIVRIDHFVGLTDFWEIPANNSDPASGSWKRSLGEKLFEILAKKFGDELPFIVEDLGYLSNEGRALRDKYSLYGMKLFMYAFCTGSMQNIKHNDNSYAPHNLESHCILYTGTHDNNTVKGWWQKEASEQDKQNACDYTGMNLNSNNISSVMCSMAMSTVADIVILPMQDILGLDSKARINIPGVVNNKNWNWKLNKNLFNEFATKNSALSQKWRRINILTSRLNINNE